MAGASRNTAQVVCEEDDDAEARLVVCRAWSAESIEESIDADRSLSLSSVELKRYCHVTESSAALSCVESRE
jgi:hypothetical protein